MICVMLRNLPVPRPVLEIISDSTIMLPNDFRKPLGFVVEFIMLHREIIGDWSGAGVEATRQAAIDPSDAGCSFVRSGRKVVPGGDASQIIGLRWYCEK